MKSFPHKVLQILLLGCIAGVGLASHHLNRARTLEGPVLYQLSPGHGLHLMDFALVLVELVLVGLLIASLRIEHASRS